MSVFHMCIISSLFWLSRAQTSIDIKSDGTLKPLMRSERKKRIAPHRSFASDALGEHGAAQDRTSSSSQGHQETSATKPRLVIGDVGNLLHSSEKMVALAHAEEAQAMRKGSMRTALVSQRAAQAAAIRAASIRAGSLELFNPSIIEPPASWLRTRERWIAAFREEVAQPSSAGKGNFTVPTWYSSSVVVAVLDENFQPTRPLRVLQSEDFFEHAFDCQLTSREDSHFGPEDPRLFFMPTSKATRGGPDGEVLLFFTGRKHHQHPNTPCPTSGGQRMFVARLGPDLKVTKAGPIQVPGEWTKNKHDVDLSIVQAPAAGRMAEIEKNWSPFMFGSQLLLEYSLEPRIVMDLNTQRRLDHAGGEGLWISSSPALQAWLARKSADAGSEVSLHGGVSALPFKTDEKGQVLEYFSILHTRTVRNCTYRSYFYTFDAVPPFTILSVSDKELPLERKMCNWGAYVAFPVSLVQVGNTNHGAELWVFYGSGDSQSYRWVLPWHKKDAFFVAGPEYQKEECAYTLLDSKEADHQEEHGQPLIHTPLYHPVQQGMTLVMMSHSRERFPDLLNVLSHYRAMPSCMLKQIFVLWNNVADTNAFEELKRWSEDGSGLPLKVLPVQRESMNNRFAIWEMIQTEGVVIQDDDMWADEAELSAMIGAWRAEPHRLIGADMERTHLTKAASGRFYEITPNCSPIMVTGHDGKQKPSFDVTCKFWGDEYSMLLPHPWVLSKKYLQLYMQGKAMTELVDSMVNCDDIYLNGVVANFTREPPVAMKVNVHRYPTWKSGEAMWVRDGNWKEHRAQCIEKVNDFYKGEPMSPDTGLVFRVAKHSNAVL